MILAVAMADLFFSRIVDIAGQAFQGFERLGQTARIQTLFNVMRLVAALLLALLMKSPTATTWAVLYLASSAACAAVVIHLVNRDLGRPEMRWQGSKGEIWAGLHFSFGLAAQGIYNDIDKSMLAKLSTLEATGIYGAAYRVIDASFTPVRAVLAASYARFFQHGVRGLGASLAYARKLLPTAAAYSLVAGICLALASPLLPRLIGPSFASSVEAVRWLAVLPLIRTVHYFAADSLTGAGFQGPRSVVQALVA